MMQEGESKMIKYCPFDERCRCYIWIYNEVLRYAQQESEELFRSNWNEIVFLLDRVKVLEEYIRSIGGTVPPTYLDDSD